MNQSMFVNHNLHNSHKGFSERRGLQIRRGIRRGTEADCFDVLVCDEGRLLRQTSYGRLLNWKNEIQEKEEKASHKRSLLILI